MIGKVTSVMLCAVLMAAPAFAAADAPVADAVQHGNTEALRSLLGQQADVNAPQNDGMTALHWAAYTEDVEAAKLLLEAGAGVTTTTRNGGITPLMMASATGNASIIEALIEAGANPNATGGDGATPLMRAAVAGKSDAISVLLGYGADPNARTATNGQTALMMASAENRAEAVTMLAAHGANLAATTKVVSLKVDAVSEDGTTITAGVNNRTATGGVAAMGGMTALLFAARDGQLDAVRALLAAGSDVNQVSESDRSSPLVIAIGNGHYDLGQFLLDHGADPNLKNTYGLAPLYATIDMQYAPVSWAPNPLTDQERVRHIELMKALLDAGADPNARLVVKLWFRPTSHDQLWVDTAGSTAFWRAAQATDVPAMRLLVAFGADPTISTTAGTTPLMVAAGIGFNGNFSQHADAWREAVDYCLELGIDLQAADAEGYTALHGAAYRGDNELVKFLVSIGAGLDARTARGWSVTDMANAPSLRSSVPLAHPDTVALLEELGAPDLTALEGETILGSGTRARKPRRRVESSNPVAPSTGSSPTTTKRR